MGKAPSFQFYPGDWRRETQVQMADMATRGVWFEMLCCMWFSSEKGKLAGKLTNIVRLLGCPTDTLIRALNEIHILHIGEVSVVNGNGENVTFPLQVTVCNADDNIFVTVINRRMYREAKDRDNTRKRVQKYRVMHKKRKCNADSNGNVTPPSTSTTPIAKNKHKDFIFLTTEEHTKLKTKFGDKKLKAMFEILNNYIGSSGKKYKSHYHVLIGWVAKRVSEEIPEKISPLACKVCRKEKDSLQSDGICEDCRKSIGDNSLLSGSFLKDLT